MIQKLLRFFFGDDVFISYRRVDGKHYASTLKDHLASMDISSFIDYEKVFAGDRLTPALKRAIRGSKIVVLVGTPQAPGSTHVRAEIEYAKATKRRIFPIDINKGLSSSKWDVLEGSQLMWIDETSEALINSKPDEAVPSPHIFEEIRKVFRHNRRNNRLRLLSTSIAIVLLAISIVGIWQGIVAGKNAQKAERRQAEALAAQLSSEASVIRNTEGRNLELSVLLSFASQRIYDSLGIESANSISELAEGLMILPERLASLKLDDGVKSITISSDSLHLIATTENGVAKIIALKTFKIERTIGDSNNRVVAVSKGGSVILTRAGENVFSAWNVFNGSRLSQFKPERLYQLQISDDGKFSSTSSDGDPVCIWDNNTGKKLWALDMNGCSRMIMRFSTNNKLFVSGFKGGEGFTGVFDAATGRALEKPIRHGDKILDMQCSPSGEIVMVASRKFGRAKLPYHVGVWKIDDDITTPPEPGNTLSSESITKISLHPVEFKAALVLEQGTAQVWDFASSESSSFGDQRQMAHDVVFDNKGETITLLNEDMTARIYNLKSKREIARIPSGYDINAAAFSVDGTHFFSAGADSTVKSWNIASGQIICRFDQGTLDGPFESYMRGPVISDDRKKLITHTLSDVTVWQTSDGKPFWELDYLELDGDILKTCLNKEASFLCTAGKGLRLNDYTLQLWNLQSKKLDRSMPIKARIRNIFLSDDGSYVLIGIVNADEKVSVARWDVLKDTIGGVAVKLEPDYLEFIKNNPDADLSLFDTISARWERLAFNQAIVSGNAKYVVAKRSSDTMFLISATNGNILQTAIAEKNEVFEAFSPTSSMVMTSVPGKYLRFLELPSLKEMRRLELAPGEVPWPSTNSDIETRYLTRHNPFSKSERYLLTLTNSRTLTIWDMQTGRRMGTIEHNTGTIETLQFNKDESFLVTGGSDKTTRIWKIPSLKEYSRRIHDHIISTTMFNELDNLIVKEQDTNTIQIYGWKKEDLYKLACSRLTRGLSADEIKKYFDGKLPVAICK